MSLKFENKRLEILKAAQKRFIRHGLFKTTIEEIARDMRVSKSSLYHYFKSKEEVYYRCIEMEIADFFGEIAGILNDEQLTTTEKFENFLRVKASLPKQYRLLYLLYLIVLSEQSTQLEDDLLLKFMHEELSMFSSALHILLPAITEIEIEALKKSYPLVSSSLPLVTGLHEILNQKVDFFTGERPAAESLITHWRHSLLK
ncbi:MAG: TetR/AcrR family transcriptional regulator [Ignavibacteriales bacterium]|nr:TetR/AcrR family transcriptional regulator [Ignavibacteriales bacterium]